jgi:hypothetical protein
VHVGHAVRPWPAKQLVVLQIGQEKHPNELEQTAHFRDPLDPGTCCKVPQDGQFQSIFVVVFGFMIEAEALGITPRESGTVPSPERIVRPACNRRLDPVA